ncbi:MAG: stage II sporulation protein M [Planctomycetes bacterium]|nr:stage II sporulation protein M [Planctomycetota bacterium]
MNAPDKVTRSFAFRRDRQASWRRLERTLTAAESHGLGSLTEKDLLELPTLHRAALSALSAARAISLDQALLAYLESLAARSHACVHGVRGRPLTALLRFLRESFPRAVRAHGAAVAFATAILALGVVTGFAVTATHPEYYDSIVPPGLAQGRDPSASTEDLREGLYSDGDLVDALALFASFLFQHNAQIGILCFALGFAAGIPVLWLLFTNGLTLGAMSALHHGHGLALEWWAWVLPHGVPELLAIALCGAAGLMQGHALLLPERLARAESLRRIGVPAATIVLGAVALLAIAALIEGFFRQLVHSVAIRTSVAAGMFILVTAYFAFAGRRER